MYYFVNMSPRGKERVPKKSYLDDMGYMQEPGKADTFPKPCKEIDMQQFLNFYFSYVPDQLESRQIYIDGKLHEVNIYYYSNVAYALADTWDVMGVHSIKAYKCTNIN